jgi:flagellar L-ring protein FlgH
MGWINPAILGIALTAGAGALAAQATPNGQRPDSARAAADSAAPAPVRVPVPPPRAAWLSDRLPLRVGDLLTVVIDEQANASERVSNNASANRALNTGLGLNLDSTIRLGPSKAFSSTVGNSSTEGSTSGRTGALTAVLAVRVTDIDANGVASIEGTKSVTVDGREQQVKLTGMVRAEDVASSNLVSSSRIANAQITYKGKTVKPKTGILGKILSILWP